MDIPDPNLRLNSTLKRIQSSLTFQSLPHPNHHLFPLNSWYLLPILSVFNKKASESFPLKKPWDHTIDLKDMFVEQKARPYQLSSKEQEELDTWLNENLRKGYIHPSKSPQTSPFFYVPKPDGTGLRPCQ